MSEKKFPLSLDQLQELAGACPTPFHIYDEKGIVENARRLKQAFAWNPGFQEFFAVKACPNPFIMKILKQEGFGMDCSSQAELLLSESVGVVGEKIMFTSNDTPAEEFVTGRELGAILNLDDISHIPFLEQTAGLPELVCFRYNPGLLKKGNSIIGNPTEAKYGFTREQLFDGYKMLLDSGKVKRFGLHTMVASNELSWEYFVETAKLLFDLAVELKNQLGIRLEFVNIGGGVGIPYWPNQDPVDLNKVSEGIEKEFNATLIPADLGNLKIYMECGRMITGPYGWLVSRVRHIKDTYKKYVGLDACMANLMRPALYGAYHHITIPGKDNLSCDTKYDVTGSLCENNDKFAIDRMLPELVPGDFVVIHDAGAHGFSMGFQYNGKLRSAELLLRPDGSIVQIRRAETVDDYFATLDFNAVKRFDVEQH